MKLRILAAAIIFVFGACGVTAGAPVASESLDVSLVPAGFPVGFSLLTSGRRQYVAYYDAQHRMTVAFRKLDSRTWQKHILPQKVGWDSHNGVTLAIDDDGYIHLSGNMHCVPLIYFRTLKPWDITSFERIRTMTGSNEKQCTYPKFMRGAKGEFIFHYRDGSSGKGNEIYNVYDCRTKTWRKLLDKPLTDGRGKMNAYMIGPSLGPDGYFHMTWVWRDTWDCCTNHDLSYARSKDLVNWETIAGRAIQLPFRLDTKGVIVDPVPVRGGIINGSGRAGFDSRKQVVISYHKFDAGGKTQAYIARFEGGKWRSRQVSKWDYRWYFKGGGSIVAEIRVGAPKAAAGGLLHVPFSHPKEGRGRLVIEAKTLKLVKVIPPAPGAVPAKIRKLESTFKGMHVRIAGDLGKCDTPGVRYILRWETLAPNRDRRRRGPLPKDSMLRLLKILETQTDK